MFQKAEKRTGELAQQASAANSLIELVAGGVCLFKVTPDMHFDVIYINETCARLFGTTVENCSKREYRLDELIHPDDKTIVYQAVGRAMATGEGLDLEYRIMKHRNKFIWCNCSAAVQRYDEDGSPVFQAVFIDITKTKKPKTEQTRQTKSSSICLKILPGQSSLQAWKSRLYPIISAAISCALSAIQEMNLTAASIMISANLLTIQQSLKRKSKSRLPRAEKQKLHTE